MPVRIGIVGLPNAGKSTLLNALARAGAAAAPYPFTTIEPNRAMVAVPDGRLEAIAGVTHPERVVPAAVEFVDIAGLVRGAHRGEGLGNQFLAHVREMDVLVHIVRGFARSDVPHVEGRLDPRRDAEIVDTELALADLATLERIAERLGPVARSGDRGARAELAAVEHMMEALKRASPVRRVAHATPPGASAHMQHLLTAKPVIYVANLDDGGRLDDPEVEPLQRYAEEQDAALVVVNAQLEAELGDLPEEEATAFRGESSASGAAVRPLDALIRAAYTLLGLVTFFSVVSAEVRAWPVPRGTEAVEAAGQIHSDMARGFVRAEVIDWTTLVAAGSLAAARDRGFPRLEGRSYQVQDGDVITFRFAV